MNRDRLAAELERLTDLVARLRGPGGCPWDAEQTEKTIRMYLLEEAYEVLEAVETGSWEDLCGELGDLLFQILFLARIAEEKGAFDLVNVLERITEKMIHRHPHVFGSVQAETPEQVAANWAKIKQEEKGVDKGVSSALETVPSGLPALLRAHRLSRRAARAAGEGLEAPKADWTEVEQGIERFRKALEADGDARERRLGDLLFALVGLAGRHGLNAEDALRKANQRFVERMES